MFKTRASKAFFFVRDLRGKKFELVEYLKNCTVMESQLQFGSRYFGHQR